jgi:hypothetical protein
VRNRHEPPGAAHAASGVLTFGALLPLLALACIAAPALAQHDMHTASARTGHWTFNTGWSAFGLYVDEGTKRGDNQFALLDWESFTLSRSFSQGSLSIGAMTSLAPLINGDGGVPQLLQTGGTYRHAWLHDRLHPGAAVMHLGVTYSGPVSAAIALVGSPPLGPAPYLHRASAEFDPLPPLGHHWQDASHQSFGVVSIGMTRGALTLEGGAFNARENDENHPVMDFRGARLDSYAGRVTFSAPANVVVSAWTGFLNEPHRLDPTTRMHRMGASISQTQVGLVEGSVWNTTALWGMNVHHHGEGSHLLLHAAPGASPHHKSHSALVESTFELTSKGSIFARAEFVEKNGEELGFLGGDLTTLYPVKSIVVGGTKQLFSRLSTAVSIGARASMEFLPEELRATYGTRRPAGFAVFVRLRRFYLIVPD